MPTKEQVRHYMQQRRTEKTPPPSSDEIRRRFAQYVISENLPRK